MNYEKFEHTDPKKNIFLINMTKEVNYHFSEMVLSGIGKYLRQGKKIGILVNKKGYSSGVICRKCGHIPQCKKCSVSISFHKLAGNQKLGMCHICKTQYPLPENCPDCKSNELGEYGMGTQKVAEFLKEKFSVDSMIIESGTANSVRKIETIVGKIKTEKKQIIIGTSLLSTPIQDYKLDLIVFLNADVGLNIPDYTASEHNFWFLYETFTKHKTANFLVQTFNPEYPSIRSACRLDESGFLEHENLFRKQHGYPPYGELCVILYKNEIEQRLFNQVDKLYKELLFLQEKYELKDEIEIFSTPPLIYKIWGKYRYNIILKGSQVKNFMDIVYSKLRLQERGFKIDWEPVGLT